MCWAVFASVDSSSQAPEGMCAGSAHFGLADSLSEALEGIYAGSVHLGLADLSSEALEGIYSGSVHFGCFLLDFVIVWWTDWMMVALWSVSYVLT